MKIRKCDIGKRCVVKYDISGYVNAMLLGKIPSGWRVYIFTDQIVDTVDADQIIEIRDMVPPR